MLRAFGERSHDRGHARRAQGKGRARERRGQTGLHRQHAHVRIDRRGVDDARRGPPRLAAIFQRAVARRRRVARARSRAPVSLAAPRSFRSPGGRAPARVAARPSVNIVGPTYGCFNSYSDLAEVKRIVAGIGADLNLVYPFEANSYDTPRLPDAKRDDRHVSRVRRLARARSGACRRSTHRSGSKRRRRSFVDSGWRSGSKMQPKPSSSTRNARRSRRGTTSGVRRTAISSRTVRSRSSRRRVTRTASNATSAASSGSRSRIAPIAPGRRARRAKPCATRSRTRVRARWSSSARSTNA